MRALTVRTPPDAVLHSADKTPFIPFRASHRKGFSTIEILVVTAILISLATVGTIAYLNSLQAIRTDIGTTQQEELFDQVETIAKMIENGLETGLVDKDSGESITSESTCGEFLGALKEMLSVHRNPFDGSPAVTFSSAYDTRHKRGKIRITCYKLNRLSPANGASCKMHTAGIRMTYFKYDCGGKCGSTKCQHPSLDCGDGALVNGWQHGAQMEKFFGKVETRYLTDLNGDVVLPPYGDPVVDIAYGKSICPGYKHDIFPKEPDY